MGRASPQFFTALLVEVILSRQGSLWTMQWAWSGQCGSGFYREPPATGWRQRFASGCRPSTTGLCGLVSHWLTGQGAWVCRCRSPSYCSRGAMMRTGSHVWHVLVSMSSNVAPEIVRHTHITRELAKTQRRFQRSCVGLRLCIPSKPPAVLVVLAQGQTSSANLHGTKGF